MADPRFFNRAGPFTLNEVVHVSGAQCSLDPRAQEDIVLEDVAPLQQADARHISFLDNVRYKDAFLATQARACFVRPELAHTAPANTIALVSQNPYKAYALTAQAFYPSPPPQASHHPTAIIDPTAHIGQGCEIGPGAVIGAGARIGASCKIGAYCCIGQSVEIGPSCEIGAHVTISHAIIGAFVRIYAGARIGQDGFGFAIDRAGFVKVPQLGRVIIGGHVEIGANTTIDRGAGPDTEIGDGTWIDNLVQIGHNVKIGRGCVLVAQSGVSGSTQIGDFVMMGGQAGIAGHLKIETGAKIAAQSGVMRDIPAGQDVMGTPAQPIKSYLRQVAFLARLIKKD
jgi:UDP-3-O-[3-hydroxymyristoyl] glucosamine N-acyltransferase